MLISLESFITTVNSIIAQHAPLKKISAKEQKLRAKPWITKGILTSINNKNKTYRKYCRAKNQTRRDELHNLHERLYFLEKEQLLFEGQFGFRNNRSTIHALIDITERIRNACDKGLYACGAFLDFKKAFDTVNHDILLSTLAHYGIKNQANNWFRSYLTQRVPFTSVNRFNSRLHLISHGVVVVVCISKQH